GGPGQQGKQLTARVATTLGDHFDPPVRQVPGRARQAELKRPAPHPPAEADSLDPPFDPRGQPDGSIVAGATRGARPSPIAGHLTTAHDGDAAGTGDSCRQTGS